MSLLDLLLVYLLIGVASSVAAYRTLRGRPSTRIPHAALTLFFWPLWAPIVLGKPAPKASPSATPGGPRSPAEAAAARVETALREGREACAGTPLDGLLSREAAARIGAEVARAAERHAELEKLLVSRAGEIARAEARILELEKSPEGARAAATARLFVENMQRLVALRERDQRTLEELADLADAMRSQIVLARFAGSSLDAASGIVSEVWARVEALGAAFDPGSELVGAASSSP